jgi:hypothetical protein
VPDVIVAHPAVEDADHEHSRETVTAMEALPPPGPKERGELSKLGWQRAGMVEGEETLVVVDPPHATNVTLTAHPRPKKRKSLHSCATTR